MAENEQRPGGETEALEVSLDGDDHILGHDDKNRCHNCGAPISATVSLRVGLGRDCRRKQLIA